MAYSDELKSEKSSYVFDLGQLKKARRHLASAMDKLKDNHSINPLVDELEENVVVDDKYYEKDEILLAYEKIDDAIEEVDGHIGSVERRIEELEEEIRQAEEEEAEDGD